MWSFEFVPRDSLKDEQELPKELSCAQRQEKNRGNMKI
jgi:hypothetical protein